MIKSTVNGLVLRFQWGQSNHFALSMKANRKLIES